MAIGRADSSVNQPSGNGEQLAAGVRRNRDLDVALARALGRPEPAGTLAGPRLLEDLGEQAPVGAEREAELVVRAQAGDRDARAELVEAFLPAIAGVARNYRGSGQVQRVELLQEGVVGLLRALERYDPQRGVPFWGYAIFWVRQAMQQLVAELTRPMVLSDRALRRLARLREAHRAALLEDGVEPRPEQLAARTGIGSQHVEDLLALERPARSLQEPLQGDDGAIGVFGELLVDPLAEAEYERVLERIAGAELRGLLAGLSDRERMVVRSRYGLDGPEQSLRQIGERLGLSPEGVRRIEARALGKLAVSAGAQTQSES